MLTGLLFAIAACFVWGAIFVIPEFLHAFSSVEVVLGRYFTYGLLSSILLFCKGFAPIRRYPLRAWLSASLFALVSNLIYYLGVVAGLRFASPPIAVLLVGMAPIVIALYGNWSVREVSYRQMIVPSFCMAAGMVFVNVADVDWTFSASSVEQYLVGLVGIFTALAGWSWYAVNNARFLKRHPGIPASEWSTLIGVCTFFWTLVLIVVFAVGIESELNLGKFFQWSPLVLRYFIGVSILGFVCSWLGCFLWNRASTYLPVSLMGPFLIFETIFGLLFIFLYEKRVPTLFEMMGVSTMLSGILLSIYVFRKQKFRVRSQSSNVIDQS